MNKSLKDLNKAIDNLKQVIFKAIVIKKGWRWLLAVYVIVVIVVIMIGVHE